MKELNTKEGLKIITAEVEKFQGIDKKIIECKGKSMVIIGKNDGNKSSLLRALQSPVNSKVIPAKAIQEGEKAATIRLKLGGIYDGQEAEFSASVYFTQDHQKGRIIFKDKDGADIKDKKLQQTIIGNIGFDIDQFIRMGLTESGSVSEPGVRKQRAVLEDFLPMATRKALYELETEHKEKYEQRADINKEVKKNEAGVRSIDMTQEELETYSVDKTVEIQSVMKKQENVAESILKWEKVKQGVDSRNNEGVELTHQTKHLAKAEKAKEKLCAIVNEITEGKNTDYSFPGIEKLELDVIDSIKFYIVEAILKKKRIEECSEEVKKGEAWLSKNAKPTVGSLSDEMSKLKDHQEKYDKIKENEKDIKVIEDKKAESQVLSDRLDAIKVERSKLFADSKLPVEELSFDEKGIYYKGLPFNSEHHPTSTILSVGVKVAIAMNPNLKCIFIKDGSMFDKKTFSKVLDFIEKKGYQLFIEMVDWNATSEAEVKFAEEFIK